jgi:hypothetical protein
MSGYEYAKRVFNAQVGEGKSASQLARRGKSESMKERLVLSKSVREKWLRLEVLWSN